MLQDGQYETLDDLANDMDLLFENAKHYNVDESRLYQVRKLTSFD